MRTLTLAGIENGSLFRVGGNFSGSLTFTAPTVIPTVTIGGSVTSTGTFKGGSIGTLTAGRIQGLQLTANSLGAVSVRYGQVNVFQRAARMCLRRARRRANWMTA